ncbi:Gti1/Pac2 family-domain-containing protein [Mycena pura]|uniref:Gti1/Pac2 family-domain-containing protein n=1 Tax=Mycena pura TaxID=153505 RepID=A0AAD6YJ17_9AGAR|nr:Gti1/Pac2 family-domain-containing protein [Mycena pura]
MKPAHFTNRANITHPALRMNIECRYLAEDTDHRPDIRDTTDAYRVIQAVRLNILPIVKRRLASHERAQLTSGNVFVWTESRDGLLRWTEGRQWSESKTRGDCLIYEEKIETTEIEKRAKAARRAMRALDMPELITPPLKRKYRPSKVDGLTKHTYTVTVNSSSGTGKWHLVAYYSAAESHRLPVVEDYEYLRNIQIPIGVFGADDKPLGINTCSRPLGDANSPYTQRSVSPTTDDSEQQSPTSRLLSRNPHPSGLVLPPIFPVLSPITLPPLASLDIYLCRKRAHGR